MRRTAPRGGGGGQRAHGGGRSKGTGWSGDVGVIGRIWMGSLGMALKVKPVEILYDQVM